MDDHFTSLTTRAQIRQAILRRIGNANWGVEVGVLRITADSIIGSLLRYGSVVFGSCMPPDLIRKIDTQVINVAARSICAADRSMRIETLHFLTGVHNFRNQYLVRCALMLDSILRASNSGIRGRIVAELCRLRKITTIATKIERIEIPPREGQSSAMGDKTWDKTSWFRNVYEEPSAERFGKNIASMFTSNAPELQNLIVTRLMGFQFTGVCSWLELAVQVLDYVRWAPECAPQVPTNLPHIMPLTQATPVRIGTFELRDLRGLSSVYHKQLAIYTAVSKIRNMGITTRIMLHGSRIVHRSSVLHGVALVEVPQYLQEAAVLQSIRIVHDWYRQAPEVQRTSIREVIVLAGNEETVGALSKWVNTGQLTLESVAASALAEDLQGTQEWLHIPLQIVPYQPPLDRPAQELPWVHRKILMQMEEFRLYLATNDERTDERLVPRIPLSKAEIREVLFAQLEQDELTMFRHLMSVDSASAEVIVRLQLTRQILKEVCLKLQNDRDAQITLARVIGATRFKYAHGGHLLAVRCPKCRKDPDNYMHMLKCYALQEAEVPGIGAIDFLVDMATKVKTSPPQLIFPIIV